MDCDREGRRPKRLGERKSETEVAFERQQRDEWGWRLWLGNNVVPINSYHAIVRIGSNRHGLNEK